MSEPDNFEDDFEGLLSNYDELDPDNDLTWGGTPEDHYDDDDGISDYD